MNPKRWTSFLASLLGLLALLQCAGCGSGISAVSAVPFAIQGDSTLHQGAQATFTATASGAAVSDVLWAVTTSGGSNAAAAGTIDQHGVYTAPETVPTGVTVQITATDLKTQLSASQAITLLETTPTVTGASYSSADNGVTASLSVSGSGWNANAVLLVDGAPLSSAADSGVFSVSVTANPKAQVQVAVQNPGPGAQTSAPVAVSLRLTPSPLAVTGKTQVVANSTSQYAALAGGTPDAAVTWAVNGVAGGASTTGTVTAQGVYTAPATVPTAGTVQISAVDAKLKQTGSLVVSLLQPTPAITSASLTSSDNDSTGTLTVKAANLGTSVALLVNGSIVSATKPDAGTLTAAISLHGMTTVQVAVQNTGVGAETSATQAIPVVVVGATARAAARLLSQSTFGPTSALIQQVQSSGLQSFLDQQFAQPPTLLTAVPATLPAWSENFSAYYVDCNWWNNVLTGKDLVRQRVAFALSEIFVVSSDKDAGEMFPFFLNTLSQDAFGNWRDLMKDVTVTPAMGYYLDMMASAKPAAGQDANENYARELMQLFSLGVNQMNLDGTPVLDASGNPIPNYTPAQVQAFARAFTGWYLQNSNASAYFMAMVPTDSKHSTDSKQLLNGTVLPAGQTAEKDMDAALDNIFQQSSLPPFISKQLIQHLVTSNPSPAYVKRVASVFVDNGSGVRGDMTAVIRAILMDTEAREMDDPTVSRPDFGHLQEPILWMSNVLLGTGFTNKAADPASGWMDVDAAANVMRQPTHAPDSVFDYYSPQNPLPGSETLLAPEFGLEGTSAVAARLDVASRMVDGSFTSIILDVSATGTWGKLAATPSDLLDRLNTVFFSGSMSASMRQIILNTITPMQDNAERARTAIFLAVSSPSFKVRR